MPKQGDKENIQQDEPEAHRAEQHEQEDECLFGPFELFLELDDEQIQARVQSGAQNRQEMFD